MTWARMVTVLALLAIAAPPLRAEARSPIPTRAWIMRADAVCARTDRTVRSLRQPQVSPANPRRGDLPVIARYLRQLAPLLAHEVEAIADLPSPAHEAAIARRFIANGRLSIAALQASESHAAHGDLHGYRRSFQRDNRYGTRASTIAKRLGLTVCGQ